MAQITTKPVTMNSVMRAPAFQQGMTDYWAGQPIPLRLPPESEWDYERGRLFAAATGHKFIHSVKGRVKEEQLWQYARLRKQRDIL